MRPIDLQKRLEMLVRDFVVSNTSVSPEDALTMISNTRAPAKDAQLSGRELEILRVLARGESSKTASEQLHISRTTVNNHVQIFCGSSERTLDSRLFGARSTRD